MKTKRILSGVFALLGAALAALALWVSISALDAQPVLMTPPAAAMETADAMMAAVCAGDFDAAADLMYGNPNLGTDRAPADEVGVLLWDAFLESLSYELVGQCYATDSGIAQDVTISCLDFSSVTGTLRDRTQALLTERVEAAENAAEDADAIYDENGDFREEFVMKVLRDVTVEALQEDAQYVERSLTMNLVYKQGQWWVVADSALLTAISSGIVG